VFGEGDTKRKKIARRGGEEAETNIPGGGNRKKQWTRGGGGGVVRVDHSKQTEPSREKSQKKNYKGREKCTNGIGGWSKHGEKTQKEHCVGRILIEAKERGTSKRPKPSYGNEREKRFDAA